MATPFSRTKALVQKKELLLQLAEPGTPGVSEEVRSRARALLLAFPTLADIEALHRASPELLGPAPPFSRLSGSGDVLGVIQGARQGRRRTKPSPRWRTTALPWEGKRVWCWPAGQCAPCAPSRC
jgi:hypothetical protein